MSTLESLNAAAVAHARQGRHADAIALLTRLVEAFSTRHLTRADIAYCNRSASLLALGEAPGALADADAALAVLQARAQRLGLGRGGGAAALPGFAKAALRRGLALEALEQWEAAAAAFEAGLAADACDARLKEGLARAQQQRGSGSGRSNNGGLLQTQQKQQQLIAGPLAAALPVTYAPHHASLGLLRGPGDGDDGDDDGGNDESMLGATMQQQQRYAARVERLASLPASLLSARRAADDPTLAEAYEYARVQTDIMLPRRWADRALPDGYRWARWREALKVALKQLAAAGVAAPRVLILGAAGGMLPLLALAAGAAHVTAAERWPALARVCGEVLAANNVAKSAYSIAPPVRQYDELTLGGHVPAQVHLIVADLVDDGVLTGGLLPAVAHAAAHLLDPCAPGPLVLPSGLDVFAQLVGVSSGACRAAGARAFADDAAAVAAAAAAAASADAATMETAAAAACAAGIVAAAIEGGSAAGPLAELDAHRWCPSQALPTPLAPCALSPLAPPAHVWSFDCLAPPERGAARELEVTADADGRADAVAVWARVRLIDGVELTTGFDRPLALMPPPLPPSGDDAAAHASDAGDAATVTLAGRPPPSQQPALIWLAGQLDVAAGDTLALAAAHNTVRLAFDAPSVSFARLRRPVPWMPQAHFAASADGARLAAFGAAVGVAILDRQQQQRAFAGDSDGSGSSPAVTMLDVGSGTGSIAALAAGAIGNSSGSVVAAVACELYAPLAAAARRGLARIGSGSSSINAAPSSTLPTVLHADAAALRPGDAGGAVPLAGFDVIAADVFGPGLLGGGALALVESARARLLAPAGSGGGRVVPASATLWAAGVQVLSSGSSSSGGGSGAFRQQPYDFGALDRYRWSPEPQHVDLGALRHARLTAPVRLFDFQLADGNGDNGAKATAGASAAAAAAQRFPMRGAAQAEAVGDGVVTGLAVWYDLDLGGGIVVTIAPPSIGAGGRVLACSSGDAGGACACASCSSASSLDLPGPAVARSAQGQLLYHLPVWTPVAKGSLVEIAAERAADKAGGLTVAVGDIMHPSALAAAAAAASGGDDGEPFVPPPPPPPPPYTAPHAPWYTDRFGGGAPPATSSPEVWRVRRCEALVAEALARAPALRLPPVWRDLQLLQLHCGSLGLDGAALGALTQALAMREEAALAAAGVGGVGGGAVALSQAASVEALGVGPPAWWH